MTLDQLRARATVKVGRCHTWEEPAGWYSPTLEDCEFLYALVRMAKPKLIVESGTGSGISARFMAEALVENDGGRIVTYEPFKRYADPARPLLEGLPVQIVQAESKVWWDADLAFIDSHPGIRAKEINDWLTSPYEGLVVVHDSNRRYDELKQGRGVFVPGSDGFWIGTAK